jgi:hypothetical protein
MDREKTVATIDLANSALEARNRPAFEIQTEKLFTATFLPAGQVHFFLSVLPYIEAAAGALMLLGLFTFWALVAGALLMLVLIFGTGARQDWATVGLQTTYGLFYYFLISRNGDNWLALDCLFLKRGRTL